MLYPITILSPCSQTNKKIYLQTKNIFINQRLFHCHCLQLLKLLTTSVFTLFKRNNMKYHYQLVTMLQVQIIRLQRIVINRAPEVISRYLDIFSCHSPSRCSTQLLLHHLYITVSSLGGCLYPVEILVIRVASVRAGVVQPPLAHGSCFPATRNIMSPSSAASVTFAEHFSAQIEAF